MKPEDLKILREIKAGNNEIFNAFYKEYSPRLEAVIYFLCNDKQQAEDIVQESFLRLWQNRESLNESQSLKGYMRTISKNLFLDSTRKQKTRHIYNGLLEEPVANDVGDRASFNELNSVVLSAISRFSVEKQEMYIASRLNGLSYNEIAAARNTTPKAVERHISKVSFHLRSYLTKYYYSISLFCLASLIK